MPLIIGGRACDNVDNALDAIFKGYVFKESAAILKQRRPEKVSNKGLLYVSQREFAVVSPSDEFIKLVGTQDATTCHVVVLRNTGSGVTALAHCDGCDTEAALSKMINALTAQSEDGQSVRIDLHIVGGFIDDRQESIKLSKSIIAPHTEVLVSRKEELHLQTACITDLNDTVINDVHFPVIYGLAVNMETGEIFPASFTDDSPALDIRSASHFVGCDKMLNLYENGRGVLTVGPFSWEPWKNAAMWASQPDHIIRQYLSTSPAQEPEHFVRHIRAALMVIVQHPKPHRTLFLNNRPHRYQIQPDGEWVLLSDTSTS